MNRKISFFTSNGPILKRTDQSFIYNAKIDKSLRQLKKELTQGKLAEDHELKHLRNLSNQLSMKKSSERENKSNKIQINTLSNSQNTSQLT